MASFCMLFISAPHWHFDCDLEIFSQFALELSWRHTLPKWELTLLGVY